MTLAIKLAIIAALILSIFIPFGYFLHGERTKKRYKRSIAFNAFFFFGIIVIAGVMMFVTDPVQAAQDVYKRQIIYKTKKIDGNGYKSLGHYLQTDHTR